MKNQTKKMFVLMCAVIMTFMITACGSLGGSGKFATLQEFVESDVMQEQLETQLASLEGTGITADLIAEDNKLIYNFTIEDPELSAAMDATVIESTLDAQASTFETVASSLKEAVEVENPVVVVRYLDNTGTEIASREFAG